MDSYVRTEAMEVSQADQVAEWSSPGGETELEEPAWQLGLGGGSEPYPERPDDADCIYYLRTGFCGYGARCRFNHPRDRSLIVGAMRASGGEYPERAGQPVCQYYMRTGMCKFGASCKYHHPRQGGGSTTTTMVALNFSGYPLRPGEKECSYYMKTGQCKFGLTCKFHHPQPAGIQIPAPNVPAPAIYSSPAAVSSSQQYGCVVGGSSWPGARPTLLSGSYFQGAYAPLLLPPMLPFPTWSPYQGPVASPNTQPTFGGGGQIYGITQLSPSASAYIGSYISVPSSSAGPSGSSQKEQSSLPERPGQPECPHFIKTGDCKFGSSCKYHHPTSWSASKTDFSLSSTGLPARPGVPLCSHYAQSGACRFGSTCKFNHPIGTLSYSPSASSLTDIPVAPYPVGSTIATLAPSSSSSELRPELISGSATRMPSSMNTSSGSVGSILSSSVPLPPTSLPPGHASMLTSGSTRTGPPGE